MKPILFNGQSFFFHCWHRWWCDEMKKKKREKKKEKLLFFFWRQTKFIHIQSNKWKKKSNPNSIELNSNNRTKKKKEKKVYFIFSFSSSTITIEMINHPSWLSIHYWFYCPYNQHHVCVCVCVGNVPKIPNRKCTWKLKII